MHTATYVPPERANGLPSASDTFTFTESPVYRSSTTNHYDDGAVPVYRSTDHHDDGAEPVYRSC